MRLRNFRALLPGLNSIPRLCSSGRIFPAPEYDNWIYLAPGGCCPDRYARICSNHAVSAPVEAHASRSRLAHAPVPDENGSAHLRVLRSCQRNSFILSFHGAVDVADPKCLPLTDHV